ncbi:hypothetical protein A0256_04005 [Mucilaginibacter sp. PAMC 26640]|nr:hypothetical protein A0256_04005 [Mucilaginibacter sp. PAMC 26640]
MKTGTIYIVCAFSCLVFTGCINSGVQKAVTNKAVKHAQDAKVNLPADTIISIVAVGDIMLGTAYPDSSFLPPHSGINSFRSASENLRSADITFGNLEGVLLNTGAPVARKLKFRSKPYLFKMPESYGGILKKAGFNILSLANNHSNDFGVKGRSNTMQLLDSLGINYAGLKTYPAKIFVNKGIKYGFCAFSPNSQTVSLLDLKGAASIVAALKAQCDVVVVSFHGGGEGIGFEHVPLADESFNGERRGNVKLFSHTVVDAGADVVLGNGPHVSRGMELYKNRLIAYSLGNFCTYRSVSVAGVCGLAPMLKMKINKNGQFLSGQIISYKQSHDNGLVLDTLNKAALRIKELTETDLENPGLSISPLGAITAVNVN